MLSAIFCVCVCAIVGGRQGKYGLAEMALFRQKCTLRTKKTHAKACGSDYIVGNWLYAYPATWAWDFDDLGIRHFPYWITAMLLRIPFAYRSWWSVTEICRVALVNSYNAPSAPRISFISLQVHPSCLFINSTDAIQFVYLAFAQNWCLIVMGTFRHRKLLGRSIPVS